MKTTLKIFSLIFIIFSMLLMSTVLGCGSPSGSGTSQITITLGVDSAKAAVPVEQLRHEITFSGPTGIQRQTFTGRGTARATVVAGFWTIEVAAYYGQDLYAVGATSTEVKAGSNTDVTIQMTVVWTDGAGVVNPAISYDKAVGSWAELKDYVENLPQPSTKTIQLSVNMAANSIITIDEKVTVTLVAPIYTTVIVSRGSVNGSSFADEMFNVLGTLNLGHGSYPDNSRVILDGASSNTINAPLVHIVRGILNMNDSVILQNNNNATVSSGILGGAVGMDSSGSDGGTFNMKGGIIRNNKASNGGGVFISGVNPDDGFYMSGGTISGNEASNGGGVLVSNGIFEMIGGAISGNEATTSGGGVNFNSANSNMSMSGGMIYGNKATSSGGGAFFNSTSGKLSINGNAKIQNNAVENPSGTIGGGICVSFAGDLSISGNAEITDNKAIQTGSGGLGTLGGGVYFSGGTFELSENAKINNNTADASFSIGTIAHGGGVYIDFGATTFNMIGGEIKGNTTQGNIGSNGGGLYLGISGFTKTGGLIDGYDSGNDLSKNKVLDASGNITSATNLGHAVYCSMSSGFGKNTDSPSGNMLNSGIPPVPLGSPGNGWDF